MRRTVLQVPPQSVVLTASLVRAARKDQRDHELHDVEMSLPFDGGRGAIDVIRVPPRAPASSAVRCRGGVVGEKGRDAFGEREWPSEGCFRYLPTYSAGSSGQDDDLAGRVVGPPVEPTVERERLEARARQEVLELEAKEPPHSELGRLVGDLRAVAPAFMAEADALHLRHAIALDRRETADMLVAVLCPRVLVLGLFGERSRDMRGAKTSKANR